MNTANTTQVCRKCKAEKQLSEFHKRGTSHQRICKACRKAHVPSGERKIVIMNHPSLYPALTSRIESLEGKLRAKAASFANDPLESDDIYAVMVEEILFKCKPEDSDARIITRATWAAKAVLRRYNAYSAMIEDESSMLAKIDDEDELIVSPHSSAESDFIHRENMAEILEKIAMLPKEHQLIVSFLAVGYNQREISLKLKKSDQAISSTIKNIANQLSALGLSPAFT